LNHVFRNSAFTMVMEILSNSLRLALIDMDGTLLNGRSINAIAKLGFEREIREIRRAFSEGKIWAYEMSLKIAKLLKGTLASKLIEEFDKIPLVRGAKEFIEWLRLKNFVVIIVSDSYTILVERIARKVGADEVYANTLHVVNGVITGKLSMPMGWQLVKGCMRKSVCKLNALLKYMAKYNIPIGRTLAIGDSNIDICMIKYAKLGVAFNPKSYEVAQVADIVVKGDFYDLKRTLEPLIENPEIFP